MYINDIDF